MSDVWSHPMQAFGTTWRRLGICTWAIQLAAATAIGACGGKGDDAKHQLGASSRTTSNAGTSGQSSGGAATGGQSSGGSAIGNIEQGSPCIPLGPSIDELDKAGLVEKFFDFQRVGGLRANTTELFFDEHGTINGFIAVDGAGVRRVVLDGASVLGRSSYSGEALFALDDTHIYWLNQSAVLRAPLATGTPVESFAISIAPSYLEVDAAYLYFADSYNQLIGRMPKTGGSVTLLAKGIAPLDLALTADFVYFTDTTSGRVGRVALGGAALAGLPEIEWLTEPHGDIRAVQPFDGGVAYTDGANIYRHDFGQTGPDRLIGHGGPTQNTPQQVAGSTISNLELWGNRLFWYDDQCGLGWTSLDGTECDLIASRVAHYPSDFAIFGEYVYVMTLSPDHADRLVRIKAPITAPPFMK